MPRRKRPSKAKRVTKARSQPSVSKPGGVSSRDAVVHIDLNSMHALEDHYKRYFGSPHMVFHEKVSKLVHIDTYIFPATETRPYMTLATIGMSALPMTLPKEVLA
jgi:hypothetical protein